MDNSSRKTNNLFVLADLHIGSSRVDNNKLEKAFKFMDEMDGNATYVINGDITTSGKAKDFKKAWNFFNDMIPSNNTSIISLGNHDVRGPYSDNWSNDINDDPHYFKEFVLPEYVDNYLSQNSNLSKIASALYFSYPTDQMNLMVLNPERGLKDAIYLSNSQLSWIEEQLQYGLDNNLTNMLVVHQPLNGTHPRSDENGGFGPQDQQLKNILINYPQTVILSGHIHNGFSQKIVVRKPFGICIDIPGFGVSENGYIGDGLGYYLKVEKSQLEFEAWDFVNRIHLKQFDFIIKDKVLVI